ncbi:MAG: thiol:disulfide interchange protein [Bdellovibrio sp.]|nr:MAG: thiol:disulfide interchange protein [Bdellovibrio sp.]
MIATIAAAVAASFALVACQPSSKQLKEAVEKDPSIVFAAIEKDPEGFIEVVNKAAQKAQQKGAEKAQAEESKKREEEFKNPLKPAIDPSRAMYGPANAPITIVAFSDHQCPYCRRGNDTLKEVLKAYDGKIRFIFKHLPLDFHPRAMPAAKYFEAIARQSADKAYKFSDEVFENQADLNKRGEDFLKDVAKKVGADPKKVEKDLKDPKLMDRINADMEEAKKFDISGTPCFIINGVSLRGAFPFGDFKSIIDRQLSQAK